MRGYKLALCALVVLSHPHLSSGRRWLNVADEKQMGVGDRYRYRESKEIGWPFTVAPTAAPSRVPAPTLRPTNARITPAPSRVKQDSSHGPPTGRPTTQPSKVPVFAPTATATTEDGCPTGYHPYLIDMYDTWGDGWEGTDIVIKEQYAYGEIARTTLTNGHRGSETVCLSRIQCYEVTVEGWSTWDVEIYWEIFAFRGAEKVKVAYGENLGTSCTFDPKGGTSGSLEGCPNTCKEGVPQRVPSPDPVGGGIQPTKPTKRPTNSPTTTPLGTRPPGYFNYNQNDLNFGPSAWGDIDTTGSLWWDSKYDNIDFSNQCRGKLQSPILLEEGTTPCQARRQIRTTPAQFSPCDSNTGVFQITPTRLRIVFASGFEPNVVMPEGGNSLQAAYLEVAVPSLHQRAVNGETKRYDAEYTIVHPWNSKGKIILISVLIDASGETNAMFQTLLDEWSSVQTCSHPFKFGGRRMVAQNDVEEQRKGGEQGAVNELGQFDQRRHLQCEFDIFDRSLVPSIYYHSYYGSLPEPPCSGNANWFVISKPMKISATQHSEMKKLLISGPCRGDPYAQNLGGRNRPIQATKGRSVEQCGMKSFWLDCYPDCTCEEELCPSDFL